MADVIALLCYSTSLDARTFRTRLYASESHTIKTLFDTTLYVWFKNGTLPPYLYHASNLVLDVRGGILVRRFSRFRNDLGHLLVSEMVAKHTNRYIIPVRML